MFVIFVSTETTRSSCHFRLNSKFKKYLRELILYRNSIVSVYEQKHEITFHNTK